MEMTKHIELPFRVYASYESSDASVGYPGSITIEDVTIDDVSVYTQDVQAVILKRIMALEGEMILEAAEYVRDQKEMHDEQQAEYIADMRRTENIIIGQGGYNGNNDTLE